ncbi:unnamed protein product, partial [Didymodactylos carnosus]
MSHYRTPLDIVRRRNSRWNPKKVQINNQYRALYRVFAAPPHTYSYYYINRTTPIGILDNLIDHAQTTQHFSIDTENDVTTHRPSLIQIQFVYVNQPSIIILIETQHLPPESSPLFIKIRYLCSLILTSTNSLYAWGDPIRELQNFLQFNLFNLTNPPIKHNIQSEFKDWFNDRYPSSPERKDEPNDQYSLQHAIKLVFNQWLDKELTLSDWGCGIDEHLATCIPQALVGMDRVRCLAGEREIRKLQTQYAINDCLSLTKLMFPVLYDWTPEQVKNYETSLQSLQLPSLKLESQYEDISDDEDMGLIPVHVQDEPLFHSPVPVEV